MFQQLSPNVDSDWDGDGVIDTQLAYLLDQRYGVPYGNLAPRHPHRSASLNFLDGHAQNMQIARIMAPPNENQDLWGRDFVLSQNRGVP